MPDTPGTTGQSPFVLVTPANLPGTLTSVGAGLLSMFLFGVGWSRMGTHLARTKMSRADAGDKRTVVQKRWQGAWAGMLFGGALYLTPTEYKPWTFVAGLPIASFFLPALLRWPFIPFMGPSDEQIHTQQAKREKKQTRRRQKQRRKGGYAAQPSQRPLSRAPRQQDFEVMEYEDVPSSRPAPRRMQREPGRRSRIPS